MSLYKTIFISNVVRSLVCVFIIVINSFSFGRSTPSVFHLTPYEIMNIIFLLVFKCSLTLLIDIIHCIIVV